MRRIILATVALCMCVSAVAQKELVQSGYMPITFGTVRQADGSLKSVRGLQLPYKMYRINTKVMKPFRQAHPTYQPITALERVLRPNRNRSLMQSFGEGRGPGNGSGNGDNHSMADSIIYNNNGGVYAVLDPGEWDNPSSLDDVTITSSGVGKLWNKLTFGYEFDGTTPHTFLVRWIVWSDKIDNPSPMNDFTNTRADFGGILTPPDNGAFVVEVDGISAAGCVCDDTSCYVATQFRAASDLTGNGAFQNDFRCVYSSTVATVGSSDDTFWFDNDPIADGNYEDPLEIEQLSNNTGSLVYTIKVNSTTSSITPFPLNPIILVTGRTSNLDASLVSYEDDGLLLNIIGGDTGDRVSPLIDVQMTSTVPTSTIYSYRVSNTSKVNINNVTQKIDIWRYSTSTWVPLDSHVMSANVVYNDDIGYGGSIPLSQFVGTGTPKQIKLRYRFYGNTNSSRLIASIDKTNWQITK